MNKALKRVMKDMMLFPHEVYNYVTGKNWFFEAM